VTVHYTTNYSLAYADVDTPLVDLASISQSLATSVDTALTAGGVTPPNASDLVVVAGRVTTLEQKARAQLYQVTAQTGLAAGWQQITLTGETIDNQNGHAVAATGYTVPAGHSNIYLISGQVVVAGVTGLVALAIRVNGVALPNIGHGEYETTSGAQARSISSRLVTLTAGQVVTLWAQVTGATWATQVDLTSTVGLTSQLTLVEL
jgi:hypothetical protein